MSDYTIRRLDDVPDAFGGQYPGAMRFLTEHLGAEQLAFTHRLMPPKSGGKGGYGHRHKTQEEIYFVISGTLQFKLGDEVVDVDGGCAVRVAPEVVRSIWNDGPDEAELVICSVRLEDPRADGEIVEGFWLSDRPAQPPRAGSRAGSTSHAQSVRFQSGTGVSRSARGRSASARRAPSGGCSAGSSGTPESREPGRRTAPPGRPRSARRRSSMLAMPLSRRRDGRSETKSMNSIPTHVGVDGQVAHREVHPVAVVVGERDGVLVEHAHEARLAPLVGALRPASASAVARKNMSIRSMNARSSASIIGRGRNFSSRRSASRRVSKRSCKPARARRGRRGSTMVRLPVICWQPTPPERNRQILIRRRPRVHRYGGARVLALDFAAAYGVAEFGDDSQRDGGPGR